MGNSWNLVLPEIVLGMTGVLVMLFVPFCRKTHQPRLFGYIALCLLVGVLGRTTRVGYWGTVLVSFFVTPLATFLFLFFFAPRPLPRP